MTSNEFFNTKSTFDARKMSHIIVSPDADSSMVIEQDFQRKKSSTRVKGNVLVDIKNKLRYPTVKSKINKKVQNAAEELVIPYKNSELPPLNLKTPKGANHSFNLDFIRGGSQTGKYQTLNHSKISIKPKMTKVDISKKSI